MPEPPARHNLWTSGLWAFLAAVGMLGWIAFDNRREDTAPERAPYSRLVGTRGDPETTALRGLVTEAYGVLRSEDFRENLLALQDRYPAVYARDAEQAATIPRIASIVALEPTGARFAPAQVELVENTSGGLGAAGEGAVSGRYSDVLIERMVLAAWGRTETVERSCAINVAAHEYAHTIVLTPMGYGNAFTDTTAEQVRIANRQRPGTPVASYLIGAVAQCTWLQRAERISRADVPACVEVFGVAAFNWDRCGQFGGGAPVALRPGLPEAAPAL